MATMAMAADVDSKVAADVGQAILAQINGADPWARARWGVKLAMAGERSVTLHLSGPFVGLRAHVTLADDDTYAVQVGRVRSLAWVALADDRGVQASGLVRAVEAAIQRAAAPRARRR